MSAVELGNEKMDAAVTGNCKPVEELLQEGLAPVQLSPTQILLVMERLLVMEVNVGSVWNTQVGMLNEVKWP
jgi:hypothetical protein